MPCLYKTNAMTYSNGCLDAINISKCIILRCQHTPLILTGIKLSDKDKVDHYKQIQRRKDVKTLAPNPNELPRCLLPTQEAAFMAVF